MTDRTHRRESITSPNLPPLYMTRDSSRGRASLVAGKLAKGEASLDAMLEALTAPAQATRPAAAEPKLRELEARLAKLEGTATRYRDIWQPGRKYRQNDQVTLAGALWICRSPTATTDRPGYSSSWRLQTKTKDR